jgi:nitrogen fixation protein FixH
MVTLTTNPDPATAAGETELVIEVKDSAGKPLNGVKVLVTADMAAHSMGAMQGEATDQGNGRYATKVPFGMGGDWKITVEVRQGDTVLATQDFTIPVQ